MSQSDTQSGTKWHTFTLRADQAGKKKNKNHSTEAKKVSSRTPINPPPVNRALLASW